MLKKNMHKMQKILFLNVFLLYLYSENVFRTVFYARPARFYVTKWHSFDFGVFDHFSSVFHHCFNLFFGVQCSENKRLTRSFEMAEEMSSAKHLLMYVRPYFRDLFCRHCLLK